MDRGSVSSRHNRASAVYADDRRPSGQRWRRPEGAVPLRSRLRTLVGGEKARFVGVGLFNTLFGYAVFAALVLAVPELHYTAALLLAYTLAVLVAYLLHRHFVFRVRGRLLRDLPRYVVVNLSALGLNLVLLPLLVAVVGLPVLGAQWLVVCVTAVASYAGHKHLSFRRRPVERACPTPPHS